ncbi:MAG: Crp/Fnr family transcriptional regulator [Bacteroidota bacterium]|nr:Crp/Fnr family transcriptional regulator [Bacteroidota bacterium]
MQKIHLECQHCDAKSISFLSYCTEEECEKVSQGKSCSHYKKGQSIFYEDNIPLGIYCISKGAIKLTRSNKDGKEQIIRFARDGEFLGYRALIADEPLVATATCIEDTICCFVPRNIFMEVLENNSGLNKYMLKALCHDLGLADERIQSLAQKSVRERLAETLLFLQQTFLNNGDIDIALISVTLPREDIANIVGTATETVIRLLSEFKNDKIIDMEGKKIRILDRKALEKISHASV